MPKKNLVFCRLPADTQSPRLLGDLVRSALRERHALAAESPDLGRVQQLVETATRGLLGRDGRPSGQTDLRLGLTSSERRAWIVISARSAGGPPGPLREDTWAKRLAQTALGVARCDITPLSRGTRIALVLDLSELLRAEGVQ